MSKELTRKIDFVDAIKKLLIQQFKNKPNFEAFLGAIGESMQEIENMLIDMWQARWLDNATGVQLDGIGSIVGIARNNLDDEAYRTRIRVRVRLNLSNGTPDDILKIIRLLLSESNALTLKEYPPASILVKTFGAITDELAEEIALAIDAARSAGVQWSFLFSTAADADTFTFSDTSSPDSTDPDRGFADYIPVGESWEDKTLNGFGASDVVRDVAFNGDSTYVAVGDNGSCSVSVDDGETWNAVTAFTSDDILALLWDGAQFVCVTDVNCEVWASADGITWVMKADSTSMSGGVVVGGHEIVFDGTTYALKCGAFTLADQIIIWSTDLITWNVSFSPTVSAGTFSRKGFMAVIETGFAANPMFLAGDANNGKMWHSPDGQTWTTYNHNLGSGIAALAVDYDHEGSTYLYIVGEDGRSTSSIFGTGTSWVNSDFGSWNTLDFNIFDIASIASISVVVGSGGSVNYKTASHAFAGPTILAPAATNDLKRVIHTGERFITVGNGGVIMTSEDGITWTLRNIGGDNFGSPDKQRRGLCLGNQCVVAYGENRRLMVSRGGPGAVGGRLASVLSNN